MGKKKAHKKIKTAQWDPKWDKQFLPSRDMEHDEAEMLIESEELSLMMMSDLDPGEY